jgi:hypothetical protein
MATSVDIRQNHQLRLYQLGSERDGLSQIHTRLTPGVECFITSVHVAQPNTDGVVAGRIPSYYGLRRDNAPYRVLIAVQGMMARTAAFVCRECMWFDGERRSHFDKGRLGTAGRALWAGPPRSATPGCRPHLSAALAGYSANDAAYGSAVSSVFEFARAPGRISGGLARLRLFGVSLADCSPSATDNGGLSRPICCRSCSS